MDPPSCGAVDHSLSCPKGGFSTLRHNEIRDFSAGLLSKVCSVAIEPTLQPLQGEKFCYKSAITDEERRLDFVAQGFWQSRNERLFFDIRIFIPQIKSYPSQVCINTYEEMRLWAKDFRCGAQFIHNCCSLCFWGSWERGKPVL